MQRHLGGLKLRDGNQYSETGRMFHMIKALSLLPESLVRMAWQSVIQLHLGNLLPQLALRDRQRLDNFISYFADTWLNNPVSLFHS
jgi:hypothetical protein